MKVLLLICALGMPAADCAVDNAVAVIQGPRAGGAAQCGFVGQAYLASTAIAGYLEDGHFLKIVCTSGTRS